MNMREAILKYKKSGEHKHFFDRKTMEFWNSSIDTELINDKYFITSDDNFDRKSKLYTIREFKDDYSDVSDIGGFQHFNDLKSAIIALEEHIKKGDINE